MSATVVLQIHIAGHPTITSTVIPAPEWCVSRNELEQAVANVGRTLVEASFMSEEVFMSKSQEVKEAAGD